MSDSEGHRQRLRQRFAQDPAALSEAELLELLLTFAIPRQDVAPLARRLLEAFGDLPAALAAPLPELLAVQGVGETTALYLHAIQAAADLKDPMKKNRPSQPSPQLPLFAPGSDPPGSDPPGSDPPGAAGEGPPSEAPLRVFTNDEVANVLHFLPQAASFPSLDEFKAHLLANLPYNAAETRLRRASTILQRFFPAGELHTPLTYFAARCSTADLQPAVFYHTLQAEPLAARLAEELVWPALPIGRLDRSQIREFVLSCLPDISQSSKEKIMLAVSNTYTRMGVGMMDKQGLRFQLRLGTLAGFTYLLTCEFPRPGIYSFEQLNQGPLHRWLLWDREGLRRQLYLLRDLGLVSKISEIDSLRQFTLDLPQPAALERFFAQAGDPRQPEHPGT